MTESPDRSGAAASERGLALLVLRYAFAAASLVLVFFLIDLDELGDVLQNASLPLIAAGVALGFANWALNTWKWRVLISEHLPGPPFRHLFRLNLVAALYGTVLPGQIAGEAVKVVRISREPRNRRYLVATILADRISGLVGLLVFGMACAVIAPAPAWVTIMLAFSLGGAVVVSIALSRVSAGQRADGAGRLRRVFVQIRGVLGQLAQFGSPVLLARVLTMSVVFQALITVTVYLFAQALDVDVSVVTIGWVMSIIAIVQLLPVTVAAIGTREGAFIVLLDQVGVARADALAISLLVLFGNLVLAAAGGIVELNPRTSGTSLHGPDSTPTPTSATH